MFRLHVSALLIVAATTRAQAPSPSPMRCEIAGRVISGETPLPGVAVIARSAEGQELTAAATGIEGTYRLVLKTAGTYALSADLRGFAAAGHEVRITLEACHGTADFSLVLQSRAPRAAAAGEPQAAANPKPPPPTPPPAATGAARGAPGPGPQGRGNGAGGPARRFQDVNIRPDTAPTGEGTDTLDPAALSLLPPGLSADAPTESIAASGNQVETVDALLFRDRLQLLDEAGGDLDALARRLAEGGFGGGAGGFGAGGGLGAGGAGGGRGARGAFGGGPGGGGPGGNNRLQGSVNYNLSGSPLNARPFSLNGKATEKAEYYQHRYGATVGGPVKIPHVYDGSTKTSFALTYSGSHTRSPFDAYSTVPTLAQREGDFSASGRVLIDPLTGLPFPRGIIPAARIDPAALSLLAFLPTPNQPGTSQNFRNLTTSTNRSNDISLRLNHMFGSAPSARTQGRPAQGQGGAPGLGGRPVGPRAPGGGIQMRRRPTLSVTITYRNSSRSDTAAFPTLGGSTKTSGLDIPVSFSFSTGPISHQLRFGFNRNRSEGTNLYAYNRDVTGIAGVGGVSRDPFNWGVPSLSFSTLSDLRDRNPSFRLDQRFSLADTATRTWRKHTFRAGFEARHQRFDSQTDENARGAYIFTGYYTAAQAGGAPVPDTGLDFADFLLGRPQQASVQFGPGRIRFRSSTISLFAQDDWRVRNNLTLNLGLRYEFVTPFKEENNHLVNLDVTEGFTAAAPVVAGQLGPFSGAFPDRLVYGDTNNLAPRIGAAWKPKSNLTVRAGFGINYNLGAYAAIAQKLAGQPPFAVSDTRIANHAAPLTLTNAFSGASPSGVATNTYGIDPRYQMPTVALWNLDVQREFKNGFTVAAGYSGTHGYNLDLVRAPNRSATGLRIPGVAPFLWQSSEATSNLHSALLRVRKRLGRGLGGGFTYTLARSLDNASAIGGGATVVAQDDTDLEAERGRSSFDRRHRLAADFLVVLPIGQGRKWLREGLWSNLIGGWVWSGTVSAESGAPFTARVVGDIADVARGVNGTLRANLTGAPVTLNNPKIQQWFNPAAFAVPTPGTFGNAGRNSITGPGSFLVNMGLIKNFSLGRPRVLSVRIQATNVFNTPQLTGIDTVVNSPTFGQVTRVGGMRTVQIQTRFRF